MNIQKNYELMLGLNDKDTKKQEIGTIDAYKICMNAISKYMNGATIVEANGFWKHESGEISIEKTLRIELADITAEMAEKIASELKVLFNQECVLVTEIQSKTRFI